MILGKRYGDVVRAFLLVGALGTGSLNAQSRWYVDDNGPDDPRPGDPRFSDPLEDGSPEHPFDALQEALDAAEDGDEVLIAEGTYTGVPNRNIDFLGKAVAVQSSRGPGFTVFDCQGLSRAFFFRQGETAESVLEGVTIRNGAAAGDENLGGGIRCESSSPTIRNCVITQCATVGPQGAGGGLYCNLSSPKLHQCVFTGNDAGSIFGARGGGVALETSSPTFVDCVISNNRAVYGGGVYCTSQSEPLFLGCQLSGNTASFDGGAMDCESVSNPVLESCIIRDNRAYYTSGLLCNHCNAVFRSCLVTGNLSQDAQRGGIDSFSNSNPVISNCTIAGNSFMGVSCNSPLATVRIENSIIYGNPTDMLNCSASFSLTTNKSFGEGNRFGDPLFSGPADFRLQPASPCLNAGNPAFVAEPGEGDLDGHARVLCDGVDMGAYERGIGDFECDGEVQLSDLSGWEGCATGPDGGPFDTPCAAFDFDADGDLDLRDFSGFTQVLPE